VPGEPQSIAVGNGLVWVTDGQQNTVMEIDPRTRAVIRTVGVDAVESNIAIAGGFAWMVEPSPYGVVERIAPGATTVRSIGLPVLPEFASKPRAIAIDRTCSSPRTEQGAGLANVGETIWFVCTPATLGQIDPASGRITVASYKGPSGVSAGGVGHCVWCVADPGVDGNQGVLWIINDDGRSVTSYDLTTETIRQTVPGLSDPAGIVASRDSVWITNFDSGSVTRLSSTAPGLPLTVSTIPVGRGPAAIAYGNGTVWVANTKDRTISRIDRRTNHVTATIKTGAVPAGIAVGAGHVWVTTLSASRFVPR
jgi:YVTN family beta-propeller protein